MLVKERVDRKREGNDQHHQPKSIIISRLISLHDFVPVFDRVILVDRVVENRKGKSQPESQSCDQRYIDIVPCTGTLYRY